MFQRTPLSGSTISGLYCYDMSCHFHGVESPLCPKCKKEVLLWQLYSKSFHFVWRLPHGCFPEPVHLDSSSQMSIVIYPLYMHNPYILPAFLPLISPYLSLSFWLLWEALEIWIGWYLVKENFFFIFVILVPPCIYSNFIPSSNPHYIANIENKVWPLNQNIRSLHCSILITW